MNQSGLEMHRNEVKGPIKVQMNEKRLTRTKWLEFETKVDKKRTKLLTEIESIKSKRKKK